MFGFSKLILLLSNKIAISAGAAFILLSGAGYAGYHHFSDSNKNLPSPQAALTATNLTNQQRTTEQPSPTPTPTPTPPSPKPKTTPVPKTPAPIIPTPPPAPPPNTTNCLPPNPSIYATYYIKMTNSQYLTTNSYANTNKLYAGLQFAGLLNAVDNKQYVVLAMDDSAWDALTPSQVTWMNASPSNMASVLGWQVITSCITYDGVNPVKNLANGTTQTLNTLNGPVTFTAGGGGLGKFDSGEVAIWDWFTSNGSVTIAGFVNPPTSH